VLRATPRSLEDYPQSCFLTGKDRNEKWRNATGLCNRRFSFPNLPVREAYAAVWVEPHFGHFKPANPLLPHLRHLRPNNITFLSAVSPLLCVIVPALLSQHHYPLDALLL